MHSARSTADVVGQWAGMIARREERMQHGTTILMYHRVLPDDRAHSYPLASLAMPHSAFETQMKWLSQQFSVDTLSSCIRAMARHEPASRARVAVTFDDGYADNYEIAAPVLERLGIRGTFFVTTGFVESREPLWFDQAAHLWTTSNTQYRSELAGRVGLSADAPTSIHDWMEALKRLAPDNRATVLSREVPASKSPIDPLAFAPMTRQDLRELHAKGHEIASHTVTHPILPQLDPQSIRDELARSKRMLEGWIDGAVEGFCYPNGDTSARVEHEVQSAGYSYACTTAPGLNRPSANPMRLARVDITPHRVLDSTGRYDPLGFRAEVCQWREQCRRMTGR